MFFERNIKLHKQQKVACKKRAWLLANPYFKPFIRRHEKSASASESCTKKTERVNTRMNQGFGDVACILIDKSVCRLSLRPWGSNAERAAGCVVIGGMTRNA
ncbi:MAG: hypothetical protein GX423_04255 [Nitrospiraceae bacterium]|nr:hypothetical protein [Nitrospiraceae bacterium]